MWRRKEAGLQGLSGVGSVGGWGGIIKDSPDGHPLPLQRSRPPNIFPAEGNELANLASCWPAPFCLLSGSHTPPGGFIHRRQLEGAVCLGGKPGCDSTPRSQKPRGMGQWEQFLDPLLEGASVPAA